jgi:hypothetical protein
MPMRPFKVAELKALSEHPKDGSHKWLTAAEDSVIFLKVNATNDEIVIYANAKCVLIHGVLALTAKVTPPEGADLQDNNMPMPDDSWVIQKSWGGRRGSPNIFGTALKLREQIAYWWRETNFSQVLCRS